MSPDTRHRRRRRHGAAAEPSWYPGQSDLHAQGNLICNWAIKGQATRRALQTEEQWVPLLVMISPTMRCNLRCTGCYSGMYRKDGELSEREIDGILAQCRRLGIYFVVISGGEPYVMKDVGLSAVQEVQGRG